jgi:hypothetical protein
LSIVILILRANLCAHNSLLQMVCVASDVHCLQPVCNSTDTIAPSYGPTRPVRIGIVESLRSAVDPDLIALKRVIGDQSKLVVTGAMSAESQPPGDWQRC